MSNNVTLLSGNAALTTGAGAGVAELGAARLRSRVDISQAREARLIVTCSEAGSTNLRLRVQFSADESTWQDGPSVSLAATGTKVSDWASVNAFTTTNARVNDVFVRPATSDGDGSNTADVGTIVVEFR